MKRIGPALLLAFFCVFLPTQVYASEKPVRLGGFGIPVGGYSGITSLGGNLYAVVSDGDTQAGFHLWWIEIDKQSGKVRSVVDEGLRAHPGKNARDAEGVAYCTARKSVFVSGEADNAILEHRMDGTLTGRYLHLPKSVVTALCPNRGFESLTYDSVSHHFWTMNESPLMIESHSRRLMLMQFDDSLRLSASFPYYMDEPQARNGGRDYYHGVSAMAAMEDGTLMVLEREARIAKHYQGSKCWCRLFRFNPQTGEKFLLRQWRSRFGVFNTRFANYEGLCVGPRLQDGRQTLIMLADSQYEYGKGPWHLRDRMMVVVLDL